MSIITSCGHEVFSGNDCIPVEYPDTDIDYDALEIVPVMVMAVWCPACAANVGDIGGKIVTEL